MSFARLQKKIDILKNPTVLGLDPALDNMPPQILDKYIAQHGETLDAAAIAALEFGMNLISGLCDIIPAVKLQSAFYEAYGSQGIVSLKLTCDFAKSKGMYVIVDGKRGDIGTTAAAYSAAYLGTVKVGSTELAPTDADALTVNAYLGSDGLKPFLETAARFDKAIFALVKTSNPSSGELQDKLIGENTLYTAVGDLIEEISNHTTDEYGYTRAGAVIGATYPDEMKFLRNRLKNTFFLVPGYGAQGGSADDARHAFDENGRGAVVNSSRGIIAAWKKRGSSDAAMHYIDAAREEALTMRDLLHKAVY